MTNIRRRWLSVNPLSLFFFLTLFFHHMTMPSKITTYRAHAPRPAKVYDATAMRRDDHRWYAGTPWQKLRRAVLARQPLCAECMRHARITLATTVHHIIERKDRPELALDEANLEALCGPCHSSLHRSKGTTDKVGGWVKPGNGEFS